MLSLRLPANFGGLRLLDVYLSLSHTHSHTCMQQLNLYISNLMSKFSPVAGSLCVRGYLENLKIAQGLSSYAGRYILTQVQLRIVLLQRLC